MWSLKGVRWYFIAIGLYSNRSRKKYLLTYQIILLILLMLNYLTCIYFATFGVPLESVTGIVSILESLLNKFMLCCYHLLKNIFFSLNALAGSVFMYLRDNYAS